MGRPLKIAESNTVDTGFNNPPGVSNTYGVVGGDTALTDPTIRCRVKIGANAEANGWILRQKGKSKFLVTDGTNTGVCSLANTANGALTADTMTVTITKLDTTTARLAYFTNRHGVDFSNNSYILSFNAAAAVPAGTLFEVAQVTSA